MTFNIVNRIINEMMKKGEKMEEDKLLYKEFLNGNMQSFENLILKYKNNIIYFITRYVKNTDKAEEIYQDTVLYMLEKKEQYNFNYSFKTYMYMIAKSKALDFIKKEKYTENIDEIELKSEELLEEIFFSKERKEKIIKIIKKLPREYQVSIFLTQIDNLSYKETAEIMGKTEKQIKTLIYNAKKKLKQLLIEEKIIEVKNNKIIRLLSMILIVSTILSGITYATYKYINSIIPERKTFTEDDLLNSENTLKVDENTITKEQARQKAEEISIKLNLLDYIEKSEIEFVNDPYNNKRNWEVLLNNQIKIYIDVENGKLNGIKNNAISFNENTNVAEKEIALEYGKSIYTKLKEFVRDEINLEFVSLEQMNGTTNIWQIDYRRKYDNLIDENNGIRITFDPEEEQIKGIYFFDYEYANNEIEISADEALYIVQSYAKENNILVDENMNVELAIEPITIFNNNEDLKKGEFVSSSNITRKVYKITWKSNKICVDSTTGEVINVSIVEV